MKREMREKDVFRKSREGRGECVRRKIRKQQWGEREREKEGGKCMCICKYIARECTHPSHNICTVRVYFLPHLVTPVSSFTPMSSSLLLKSKRWDNKVKKKEKKKRMTCRNRVEQNKVPLSISWCCY